MFRPPSWNRKTVESWGQVKSLPSVGERKKNWGRGKNPSLPPSPTRFDIVILAPILPVCSESKIAAKHLIDHQNRLHCRLDFLNTVHFKNLPFKICKYHKLTSLYSCWHVKLRKYTITVLAITLSFSKHAKHNLKILSSAGKFYRFLPHWQLKVTKMIIIIVS